MNTIKSQPDSQLVADALLGNRDAFAEIVNRYRNLLCSLAFSKAGSIAASEDIAQEAFVVAWRNLPQLREPGLLRSWLSGIVRRISASQARADYRRDGLQPVESLEAMVSADEDDRYRTVEPLDSVPEPERSAENEQESLLVWQALAKLPDKYREPLILFYREEQSVTSVANALGLAEDAARQRLYRGRQLLRREMTEMIEGTLRRTAPTLAFTAAVMSALPALTPAPAMASSVALAAGAASKVVEGKGLWAVVSGWPIAGPLFGLIAGLGSAHLAAAVYPQGESRRLVQRHATMIVLSVWIASLLLATVLVTGHEHMNAPEIIGIALIWTVLLLGGIWLAVRRMEKLLAVVNGQGGKAGGSDGLSSRSRSCALAFEARVPRGAARGYCSVNQRIRSCTWLDRCRRPGDQSVACGRRRGYRPDRTGWNHGRCDQPQPVGYRSRRDRLRIDCGRDLGVRDNGDWLGECGGCGGDSGGLCPRRAGAGE